MSITYAYWGDFRRIANVGSGFGVYGYPLNAGNNVYNNPSTAPFVATPAQATVASNVNSQWSSETTDRSSFATVNSATAIPLNGGVCALVCGGYATFNNAFGVAFNVGPNSPADLTMRFILMPNTHGTADGTPNPDPTQVTQNVLLPCPVGPGPFTTIGTDVMGTPIYSPNTFNDYFSAVTSPPLRNYFFVLQDAWKFNGTDWYVDTTAPIWFQGPAALNPTDLVQDPNRRHSASQTNPTPPTSFNANLMSSVAAPANALGMEDLPNYTGIIVPPTNTWYGFPH